MKRFLILFTILLSPLASAQEEVVNPGITPSDIGYGLDLAVEKLLSFITKDPQKNAILHLNFARERLAEMESMAGRNVQDNKFYQRARDELDKNVNSAVEKAKSLTIKVDMDNLLAFVEQQTTKHLEVLENVKRIVPQAAMEGIENAIQKSQQQRKNLMEGGAS